MTAEKLVGVLFGRRIVRYAAVKDIVVQQLAC